MSGNRIDEAMSRYIHLSKYSRWLPTKKRRETWEETVDRLIDFWRGRLGDKIPEQIFVDLRQSIVAREVMPSMRTLMTAGPALERDEVAGFNPVTGDTKVLTKEYGYVPIKELEGLDVTVLNCKNRWASATFQSFGRQRIFNVTFKKNSNTKMEVKCTANHRWLTSEGIVKHTDELIAGRKGDKIPYASLVKSVDTSSIDYKLGVAHGIVYGDGTGAYSQERLKGYLVRLCGDKRNLLEYLMQVGGIVTYPPSFNGDPVVQFYGSFSKTHELKSLPSHTETDDYLTGFIRGWLACDGNVSRSKSTVTLCMNREGMEWFCKYSASLGFVVQNVKKQPRETNYGVRTKDSFVLTLDRSSLVVEDVLDEEKKVLFKSLKSRFSIESVVDSGTEEEVWCALVPDTNTFVLERGLVTGNCCAVGVDNVRVFDEIFYLLMNG